MAPRLTAKEKKALCRYHPNCWEDAAIRGCCRACYSWERAMAKRGMKRNRALAARYYRLNGRYRTVGI